METNLFLIRDGVTDWHAERKVLGHRDISLNDEGLAQSQRAADALDGITIAEVISSPLVRALQTAEFVGRRFAIEVARDPRLIDFRAGKWEGMAYDEVSAHSEFQAFVKDPLSEQIPGADSLRDVSERAVAAVEQALEDNPSGDAIAVITHAGIIRVLLTHYLGSPPGNYHRIHVSPGSISVLSFADDRELPRVLAVNWCDSVARVVKTHHTAALGDIGQG